MKLLQRRVLNLAGALLLASVPAGLAQTIDMKMDEELVKFKKGEVAQQKTPEFSVQGVTQKKSKSKDWLELEFEFEAKQSKETKEKQFFHDAVTLKYYAFLDNSDKKKWKTLTAEVNYVNVPIGETAHTVVYLSPTALVNLTKDKLVSTQMVKLSGVEATIGGKLVGWWSSNNTAWWKHPSAPPVEQGHLQLKANTPFAPLFADYYVEESKTK